MKGRMKVVTPRDQLLFQKLASFGILSTPQVRKLVFQNKDKTLTNRRLRKLKRINYIEKAGTLKDGTKLWWLTPVARTILGIQTQFGNINRNTVDHDVAIGDLRMALENTGYILNWRPGFLIKQEVQAENKRMGYERSEVEPDAICLLNTKNGSRLVAIELELTGKTKKRYQSLFEIYVDKKQLNGIIYIVPNHHLGELLLDVWKGVTKHEPKVANLFWVLQNEMLTDPKNAKLHYQNNKTITLSEICQK